jgi:hypothetical protein
MECNANGIWRQRYELSKQLQDLHIDVALLSGTHIKHHERFFIPNYYFYRTGRFPGRIGRTAVAGNPHNHVDLPPFVSIEAAGVCIPIGIIRVKCYLQQSVSHQATLKMIQTSLSS